MQWMHTQYAGRPPCAPQNWILRCFLCLRNPACVCAGQPGQLMAHLSSAIDTEEASAAACQVGTLAYDTVRLSSLRYELPKLTAQVRNDLLGRGLVSSQLYVTTKFSCDN